VWVGIAVAVVLGGCAGIFVLGARSGTAASDQQQIDFDKLPALTVTPEQLITAYRQNKLAADELYRGKKIAISGFVEAVDAGLGGQPVVRLKGTDLFHSVGARDLPHEMVTTLRRGQRVEMVCKGDGAISGSPMLQECNLR
jgi:hypothetical protein